ncbi:MAG: DUF3164 family protein [Bacteroidetes bacterium]|nr:DUF3164 family protein [Bacteroidota bacterium]
MKKEWTNHKGEKVPAVYVPAIDKKKERYTFKMLKEAEKLENRLRQLKLDILTQGDELYAEILRDAKIKATERKGNYSLYSFDKAVKIEISVQNRVEFNDNINLAQEKINEFLEQKSKSSDMELMELVNNAFKTKKGRLDSKRILSLFGLNIKNKTWVEAMELIKKSIETNNSKRYVNVWKRDAEGEYKAVQLNFSAVTI